MSYWQGSGLAPGYSKAVEQALNELHDAEHSLQSTLAREYPLDASVNVVHSRGEFRGVVAGWDFRGARVAVRNDRSGKVNKWWAAHVEVLL